MIVRIHRSRAFQDSFTSSPNRWGNRVSQTDESDLIAPSQGPVDRTWQATQSWAERHDAIFELPIGARFDSEMQSPSQQMF
jgi:hypothetical protein